MFAAASRLVPLAVKSCRQIIPPVIATLIAAGLISAYNRAFTGHLQQPRLAALHQDTAEAASEVAKPLASTGAVAIYDNIAPPARLWEKEAKQESGKDQAIKVAEPVPAPVRAAAPRPEKSEPRAEQRRVAVVEPAPVIRAPAAASASSAAAAPVIVAVPPPVVAPPAQPPAASSLPTVQELRQPVLPAPQAQPHYQQQYGQQQQPSYQPPPLVTAQPVTVPDRPRAMEPAQTEAPNPPQGPIGKFVDTLKPSNLLARAREFGEKIEQAGNDILPNIRPQ